GGAGAGGGGARARGGACGGGGAAPPLALRVVPPPTGPGANVPTANAPGRWVSRSTAAPPRPTVVQAWSRAIVSARRSGDGWAGSRSENCTTRAGVGSAVTVIACTASPGEWASRSRRSSVRQVRGSAEGAAGLQGPGGARPF